MKTIIDLVTSLKTYFIGKDTAAKQAVEANIAPIETDATGSAHAYAIGDQLILNDVLYNVTAAIAIGDALATSGAGENITAADDITTQIYTGLGDKLSTYAADSSVWDSTPTANSTKPVTSGGLKTAIDGKSHVEVDESGTASASKTHDFTISVDGGSEYPISRYMEQTQTVSTSNDTTYTFTNAAITADSAIDVYASEYGINPSNVAVSSGSCVVTIPAQSSAISLGIRIYIK